MKISEWFEPLKEIVWRDQAAHAAASYIITTLAALVVPWWLALLLSMLVAVVREQFQHPLICGPGCRTDLAFWLAGSVAGVAVIVVAV